jgi:hypothetical protein
MLVFVVEGSKVEASCDVLEEFLGFHGSLSYEGNVKRVVEFY